MTDSKFVLSAATILDISRALDAGTLSSERLVQLYASRIEAYDKQGPQINAPKRNRRVDSAPPARRGGVTLHPCRAESDRTATRL